MKLAPVINANFLNQAPAPSSPLHSDYLAYRRGNLTRAEWIDRLPHVAMLGDSVCTGIHISTPWGTFWRARTQRTGNWFLDMDSSPNGIRSVSKRLESLTSFVATEYAGLGAMVDHKNERPNFFRRILGTRHFSGQVTQLLAGKRFPDLILISLGHNNADWTWWSSPGELENPADLLQRQSRLFRKNFTRQMRRALERALGQPHRVAIVVYGLVNFGEYFKAREEAERRRAENAKIYPHMETTYRYFKSMRPSYRQNLVRMALLMNDQLRLMVDKLNAKIGNSSNVLLQYSDALAKADLNHVELLHDVDGWHPSTEGHNVLADAAYQALEPSLEFLGLKNR